MGNSGSTATCCVSTASPMPGGRRDGRNSSGHHKKSKSHGNNLQAAAEALARRASQGSLGPNYHPGLQFNNGVAIGHHQGYDYRDGHHQPHSTGPPSINGNGTLNGGGPRGPAPESMGNLQHISEREPDDWTEDPSLHPTTETIFMEKSKLAIQNGMSRKKSQMQLSQSRSMSEFMNGAGGPLKKASSCSTIFIDDSTVSQPNLKNTIKCVALAVYYHIKNRTSEVILEIFDEKLHPLTRDSVSSDYNLYNPEHRQIYRFIRTLFNAAQLSAECAIITLVYLERLLKYSEVDITPGSWKRITLGAILLASKVWDDQAVWNVDYCQILKDLTVEDMNELERQFLELLQFNINVPSSVYAKYYFDLRTLAEANDLIFPAEPLSKERAQRLEAVSQKYEDKINQELVQNGMHKRWASMDKLTVNRRSVAILS